MAAEMLVNLVIPTGGRSITATAVRSDIGTFLITLTATAVLAVTAAVLRQPMWVKIIRRVNASIILGIFVCRGFII